MRSEIFTEIDNSEYFGHNIAGHYGITNPKNPEIVRFQLYDTQVEIDQAKATARE